jgi:hypothetical protein
VQFSNEVRSLISEFAAEKEPAIIYCVNFSRMLHQLDETSGSQAVTLNATSSRGGSKRESAVAAGR